MHKLFMKEFSFKWMDYNFEEKAPCINKSHTKKGQKFNLNFKSSLKTRLSPKNEKIK